MNGDMKILERSMVQTRPRVLDYVELMKPELTFLSMLSALCGFYLGTTDSFNVWLFVHTALGTMLLGGGAGALNQYIERNLDAKMKRTERRPLPSGRLMPFEVLVFGSTISLLGILELSVYTNILTGFLGTVTFITYLFLYTPLKRVTHWSTIVGAVPGALPPMMGWAAVRNNLSIETWVLFAILFCWQIPHFLSLAWMYKKDYARAGFKMLTVLDDTGKRTSRQIILFTIVLLPATIMTTMLGMTGRIYIIAALLLGAAFLYCGALLVNHSYSHSPESAQKVNYYARRLFFASLLYLPMLMTAMSIDKV